MTKQKKKAPQYKGQKKSKALLHFQSTFFLLPLSIHWPLCVGAKACPSGCPPALLLVSFGCVLSGGTNSVVRDAKDSSGRWEKIITGWKSDWFVVRHGAQKTECNTVKVI